MHDPDLLAAIRDLHMAITTLTNELRQHRLADQQGIEAIIELHKQPKAATERQNA